MNKIKCVIITGPSGVGKTTLVDQLLLNYKQKLVRVITCTTRAPRENEQDGVHYRFFSLDAFKKKEEADQLLESEKVYTHWYGVLHKDIKKSRKTKKIPILTLSCHGAQKFYNKEGYLVIYITPASCSILEQRLRKRNTETKEQLDNKLQKCNEELQYQNDFDEKIVNITIKDAVLQFKKIMAQRDLSFDMEKV